MITTLDGFLGGRLQLRQPQTGFRSGSDAVLLAAACPARPGQSVLDLGCGVGAAMYCLGARVPGVALTGVERESALAALARENGDAEVIEADILAPPPQLRRPFDHVMCNPPYLSAGQGSASPDGWREAALREFAPGALADWVEAACRRVAPKGTVTFITRTDRLADLLRAMRLGAIVILPIAGRANTAPGRVIVQGTKAARAPLRMLPAFVMHEGVGHQGDRDQHSAAAQAVLRGGGEISLK